MTFLHTQLDNKLTIIGEQNPNAQSMAAGYFIQTGSRDETPDLSGVSHFLEHMMFKGTDRRSADEVNREFDELGAQYNAFTSEEETVYFGRVLPEFQDRLVDLLTDMMRPSLRTEDFDLEKNVILEEIARYEDIPSVVAYEEARERFYGGHALGNRILGTNESLKQLTRDQMLAYFERRYSPGNMVFALTGNFDWDAAVAFVSTATAQWHQFDTPRDRGTPPYVAIEEAFRSDKFSRAHVVWMSPAPTAQSEDRYAAGLIASTVGDDVGSRLYWALVDRGLVDEASISYHEEDHAGLYVGYASCEPDKVQEIYRSVRDILAEAQKNGLTNDEIERAKQKTASAAVLHAETPMGRLVPLGRSWVLRREYRELDESINRLLAVTPDEVSAVLSAHSIEPQIVLGIGPIDRLSG